MAFSVKFDKLSLHDPLYILRDQNCISFTEDLFCLRKKCRPVRDVFAEYNGPHITL